MGLIVVALAVVAVLGLVAFAVTQGDDDEDSASPDRSGTSPTEEPVEESTTTTQDPAAAAEDAVRVELVVAARPVVEAIDGEVGAAIRRILEVPAGGGGPDVATTRATTDGAVAALQTTVSGAGASGEAYSSALSGLGTLATLRAQFDSIPPGIESAQSGELIETERAFHDLAVGLVDAAEAVGVTVEHPDQQIGTRLFVLGLRQPLVTRELTVALSDAFNNGGPTLDDAQEVEAVSQLWTEYSTNLETVVADSADATDSRYATAAQTLEDGLAQFGYLATVPDIIDGAPIDFDQVFESTSEMPPNLGWPGFVAAVEGILTTP